MGRRERKRSCWGHFIPPSFSAQKERGSRLCMHRICKEMHLCTYLRIWDVPLCFCYFDCVCIDMCTANLPFQSQEPRPTETKRSLSAFQYLQPPHGQLATIIQEMPHPVVNRNEPDMNQHQAAQSTATRHMAYLYLQYLCWHISPNAHNWSLFIFGDLGWMCQGVFCFGLCLWDVKAKTCQQKDMSEKDVKGKR